MYLHSLLKKTLYFILKRQNLFRLIKFALVGFMGLMVNSIVLYFFKEYIFKNLHTNFYNIDLSLNISLLIATFASILNNFYFHSTWTWSDRKNNSDSRFIKFIRYCSASLFGISLYFIGTNILVKFGFNYIFANLLSVLFASFFNFIINNTWSFKQKKI